MKVWSSLLLTLTVFCVVLQGVHANDPIDGGIMLRITNNFLDTIKTQLISEVFSHFRPTNTTYGGDFDLDLFKVFYNVSEINMNEFGMDYKASTIKFQKESPNIVVDLKEFRTNLDFDFNLTARPKFYDDVGKGAVHFEFDKFRLGLSIAEVQGVFQFVVEEVDAQLKKDSSGSYFAGTGDISFILNQASTLLQGQLMAQPNETIGMALNMIIPQINGMLAQSGCKADLGVFSFDWCAMQQPIFSDNDLLLVFKGEATPSPETPFPYQDLRKIPYSIDRKLKDVSLFISDYTLNTTLWSAYKNGLLEQDIRSLGAAEEDKPAPPIPASTLFILFPELSKHVDKDTPLSILVKAVDDVTPVLNINNGETTIDLMAKVSFATVNSQGMRDPFLEVKSNVNVAANFRIDSPFTFKTDISKMRFRADELSLDKFSLTNVRDLNSIIGTMSGFVRNYANRVLSGMKWKEFDLSFIKMNVEKTVLKEMDRYMYGSMSPRFHGTSTLEPLEYHQVVSKFEIKPVTYEDKVNAMAELLKYTPLYTSIKEYKKNQHLYQALGNVGGGGFGMKFNQDDDSDAPLPKERGEDYNEAQE